MVLSGCFADAATGSGFDSLQIGDEVFDFGAIEDLVDGLIENGVKPGSELVDCALPFGGQYHRFRSSIFGISAALHQLGFLGPVEHAGDVALAQLKLSTKLDGTKSPLWSQFEPDQQIEGGRVESGAGDRFAIDSRRQRNLGC